MSCVNFGALRELLRSCVTQAQLEKQRKTTDESRQRTDALETEIESLRKVGNWLVSCDVHLFTLNTPLDH